MFHDATMHLASGNWFKKKRITEFPDLYTSPKAYKKEWCKRAEWEREIQHREPAMGLWDLQF